MKKVLIADEVHPVLFEGLQKLGYEVDYRPEIEQDEINVILGNYTGVIINSKTKIRKDLIEKVKCYLKFIGRLGSGMEIIDVTEAQKSGITVFSAPEGNARAVAEHALGMILALFNKLCIADREVRNKIWNREANRGVELQGKTVGIIGLGNNGSAFAEILSGFGVQILGYDKYRIFPDEGLKHVELVSLEELKERSDIISLHIPLNGETKYYIDKKFIDEAGKPFYLINTSRGKIVRTQDLLSGILSGKILGACLDVFENENPATYSPEEEAFYNELFRINNIVLSPHIAGWTKESKQKIAEVLVRKISSLEFSE